MTTALPGTAASSARVQLLGLLLAALFLSGCGESDPPGPALDATPQPPGKARRFPFAYSRRRTSAGGDAHLVSDSRSHHHAHTVTVACPHRYTCGGCIAHRVSVTCSHRNTHADRVRALRYAYSHARTGVRA